MANTGANVSMAYMERYPTATMAPHNSMMLVQPARYMEVRDLSRVA